MALGNDPIDILLVEDNPVDVRLLLRANERTSRPARVAVVSSGADALAHLRREHGYADARRPQLVLLDLALPSVPGLEILKEIKADESLDDIPVVILTSSVLEADIQASYREKAAAFVTKPHGIDGFTQVVEAIERFWGELVSFAAPPSGS